MPILQNFAAIWKRKIQNAKLIRNGTDKAYNNMELSVMAEGKLDQIRVLSKLFLHAYILLSNIIVVYSPRYSRSKFADIMP